MSKLLFDELPILVLPKLAQKVGLNEAIVLQQLHYWLQKSDNRHDGNVWVYNSIEQWTEQFPFWSKATVRRIIEGLRKSGFIIVGNYNRAGYDRTLWYTIDYTALNRHCDIDGNVAECANACAQIEQMDLVKMSTPIPETISETTTNIYMAEPLDILGQQHDTAPDEPPPGIDPVDKQLRAVTTAYEANIGMLTYIASQQLVDLLDEHGADNVIRAIVDSARRNKRSIQYITAVLENAKRERVQNRGIAYRDPVTGEIKYAT